MRFWSAGRILCPQISRNPAFLGHRMCFSPAARILCPAAESVEPPQAMSSRRKRCQAAAGDVQLPQALSDRRGTRAGMHKRASSLKELASLVVEIPGRAGNDGRLGPAGGPGSAGGRVTPRDGHGVRHGHRYDVRRGLRDAHRGHHDVRHADDVRRHGARHLHPVQRR